MARVTSDGIKGTIGNLVFYIMDGKQYGRSKPGKKHKKRNQPPNPETTAFSLVSQYGSNLLTRIRKFFLFHYTRSTYNSTRGWMCNQYREHQDSPWLLSEKSNSMCQLNKVADLRDFLAAELSVTDNGGGQVTVTIGELNPVKDIKTPARTKEVKIKVVTAASTFEVKHIVGGKTCMEEYSFPYTNIVLPAQNIVMNTKGKTTDMAIIVVAVEFNTGGNSWVTDVTYLPAAIIAMGRLG